MTAVRSYCLDYTVSALRTNRKYDQLSQVGKVVILEMTEIDITAVYTTRGIVAKHTSPEV